MKAWLRIRIWVLALSFAILITPVYFVAWWTNFQALGPPFRTPPRLDYYYANWYIPLIVEHLPKVLTLGILICILTITFLVRIKNRRRWRLVMGLWFWFVGFGSSFILVPLWNPQYFLTSFAGLVASQILSLLASLVPGIVGILVAIMWLLVSFLIAR